MTVYNKRAFVLAQNATIEPVFSAGITLHNNGSILLISSRGFAYITEVKAREHMEMMCFSKNLQENPVIHSLNRATTHLVLFNTCRFAAHLRLCNKIFIPGC